MVQAFAKWDIAQKMTNKAYFNKRLDFSIFNVLIKNAQKYWPDHP
jgi:hypothetical protein